MTSRRQQAVTHPEKLGFLAFLREIERSHPDKPRIGRNTHLSEETVTPRQDPFLAFPGSEIAAVETGPEGQITLLTRVFGLFGPQGPLPLHLSVEMQRKARQDGETAPFVAFANLLTSRFLQLLFRVWSDSRAITQLDHPVEDRFQTYLGAFMGLASPALRTHAAEAGFGISTLPLSGIIGARVRSPVRLRQILEHVLNLPLTIEENVPMWLRFEAEDRTAIGRQAASLGEDCVLGQETPSINDRIRIHLDCPDLATYQQFLPGQPGLRQIAAICNFYLGTEIDVEIAPALRGDAFPAMALDGSCALGWTAWMDCTPDATIWRRDALFQPE